MFLFKFIKKYYKIFIVSIIFWLTLLIIWNYLDKNYNIQKNLFTKLSKEFLVTTVLGVVTTIFTGLYNYQKAKTKENLEEINKNREILEKNKDTAILAIRRLEDMIDQQTFELRKLDDINLIIEEIRHQYRNQETEYRLTFRAIDTKINKINLRLEQQKEQLTQGDRILRLSNLIREDIKERELLKIELKQIINNLKQNKNNE